MAHCPVHNDRNPSLSIRELDGRVLVHCFASCSQQAVIRKLIEVGLWEPRQTTPEEREAQRLRRYYEERAKEARLRREFELDQAKLAALERDDWEAFIPACRAQGELLKKLKARF